MVFNVSLNMVCLFVSTRDLLLIEFLNGVPAGKTASYQVASVCWIGISVFTSLLMLTQLIWVNTSFFFCLSLLFVALHLRKSFYLFSFFFSS